MDLPFKNRVRSHKTRSSPIKLPLVFLASVILPAIFLAYMGLRAVEDDTEGALIEQTHTARRLQGRFEEIVQDAIQSLRENAKAAAISGTSIELPPASSIHHAFCSSFVMPPSSRRSLPTE